MIIIVIVYVTSSRLQLLAQQLQEQLDGDVDLVGELRPHLRGVCMRVYIHIYIYIYMYRERERGSRTT